MRIIVFVKEVLDPDAVNSYALAGRLTIGEDGRTITQAAIPLLMNAYDEQAIEAALRIRDADGECRISVVTAAAGDPAAVLKHAAALGADDIVAIDVPPSLDWAGVARVLAAYVKWSGGADLLLFGRQASDDDQGIVPALTGEMLGIPVITIARAVSVAGRAEAPAVRVTRVTPAGDETVECDCPAVVTVSSELGQPRYPTAARAMAARRIRPQAVSLGELSLTPETLRPLVSLRSLRVPQVQGNCEFVAGGTPAETARRLVQRLREERVIA